MYSLNSINAESVEDSCGTTVFMGLYCMLLVLLKHYTDQMLQLGICIDLNEWENLCLVDRINNVQH